MQRVLRYLIIVATIWPACEGCTRQREGVSLATLERDNVRRARIKSIQTIETYYHHSNRDSLRGDAFKKVVSFDQIGRMVGESYCILGFSNSTEQSDPDSFIYFYDTLDRPTSDMIFSPRGVSSVRWYTYSPGVEIQTEYAVPFDRLLVDVYFLDSLNRVSCLLDYEIGFNGAQDTGIYLSKERTYEYDASGKSRTETSFSEDGRQLNSTNEDLFQFRDGQFIQTKGKQYKVYDSQGYITEEYWWRNHSAGAIKLFYNYQRNQKGLPIEHLITNAAGDKVSLTSYSYQYYSE